MKRGIFALLIVGLLTLTGCDGDDGKNGVNGLVGPSGMDDLLSGTKGDVYDSGLHKVSAEIADLVQAVKDAKVALKAAEENVVAKQTLLDNATTSGAAAAQTALDTATDTRDTALTTLSDAEEALADARDEDAE